jgi:hypothetical protein
LTNINRAAAFVVTMKSNPLSGGRDEFQIEVRKSQQRGAQARRQTTSQAGAQGGYGT